uniref:Terminase large subunit n=1 Tax=Siphoviridae sp. ctxMM9 TaxID=2827973 RepID=A0A8S5T7F3_9CAUD|nr:MAG TPA: Terminase large subunit [Siphoviridae sp. ctxMM9]
MPEPPKETLKLYFFQRIFLRAAMRYKYNYVVYPRASTRFMAPRIFL